MCQQNQASQSPGCLPEAGEFTKVNATLQGLWEVARSVSCVTLKALTRLFWPAMCTWEPHPWLNSASSCKRGFLTALEGRKQEGEETRGTQPSLRVSLQSRSRENLFVQDLEQRNAGALIIISTAVVEMPLTLTSALVRIIITLEDPRRLSKLISCLCRVDGFFSSLWVINRTVGDGGNPVGGSCPEWSCVHAGSQIDWC